MPRFFETEFIGKSDISTHFCRCEACRRLTMLSTYSTTRFVKLFNMPLLPTGRYRMVDECPQCGNRGVTAARKYEKERKRNLALMMEGFASEPDNPDNCAHALHTLMIYNMKSWFHDVQKSYGLRFETNMHIQHLIAQGLSRFGDYQHAMIYCRKAIVLGAGRPAEELLSYCQTLLEAQEGIDDLEALKVQPESSLRAYIPLMTLSTSVIACLIAIGASSLRNYKAWIVNGSLEKYSFALDDQHYALSPGDCKQITLRLGEHTLTTDYMPTRQFTYSVPLIKQLLNKHLLVINPDAMAVLAVAKNMNNSSDAPTTFSTKGQIRIFPGLRQPTHGLHKISAKATRTASISLYRPDSHMEMVYLLHQFNQEQAAIDYARRALIMNPATDEASQLLDVALAKADDKDAQSFLKKGLKVSPTLLPWHLYYQNYMMIHHPEKNLEHEYTVRCKAHPNEPQCYYLLARVIKTRKTAYAFYVHSDEKSGMGGRGYYAIARDLFVRGQFREALPFIQKAMNISSDNPLFSKLKDQILLASRDYDTLLKDILQAKPSESSRDLQERKMLYLTCDGYHRQAADLLAGVATRQADEIPKLNAIRFYAVGNINDYLDCLVEMNDPHAAMEKYLHANQVKEANELIAQAANHPYWEHLVLYCAAMNQGLKQIAERNMEKAIKECGQKTVSHYQVARLLSGKNKVSPGAVRSLDIDAPEKAVLCVALGFRFPAMQQQLNDLALVYNFTPAYPQILLKQWIREAEVKPSTATGHPTQPMAVKPGA